jgi:uncharacterized protein YndB with AHSA1/START domain
VKLIQQSMLIRGTADNIYTALTSKEDLEQWWGLVNPNADGATVWYGMDRQYEVPIVADEPGKLLSFAFDSHHPYDEDRIEPTTISITVTERGYASVVTVVQSMFSDEEWNTLIHDGWVYSLLSLQLWVEKGIAFSQWKDPSKYHTVTRMVTLAQDAHWTWNAITHGNEMSQWLEAEVTSDPVIGGEINIVRDDDTVIGGEWTLLSEPRNLICHWWDAVSLDEDDDPGVITVQMWTIVPAVNGSIIRLSEYGHEFTRVKKSQIRRIEAGWDTYLANLQQLAEEES